MKPDSLELTLWAITFMQIITMMIAFYAFATFYIGPAKPLSRFWAYVNSIGRILSIFLALFTGFFLQMGREHLIYGKPLIYDLPNPVADSALPSTGRAQLPGRGCFNFTSPAQDHYRVLGLPRDAAQDLIQPAHKALTRACHPDKLKEVGWETANENYARLSIAYDVLKDEGLRCDYDCDDLFSLFHRTAAQTKYCDECKGRKHLRKMVGEGRGPREEPWSEAASILKKSREAEKMRATRTRSWSSAATGAKEQEHTMTESTITQEPTVTQVPAAYQDHEWDDVAGYWDDYEDEMAREQHRPQHNGVSAFVHVRAAAGETGVVLKKHALVVLSNTRNSLKRFPNTAVGRQAAFALVKVRSCIEHRLHGTALDKYVSYATGKMRVPVKRFMGSPLGARMMVLLMKGVIPILDDMVKFWQ